MSLSKNDDLQQYFWDQWSRESFPFDMATFVSYVPSITVVPQNYLEEEKKGEWDRARGIGASEIASAANVEGAYMSRMALFDLKTKKYPPIIPTQLNFILQWGNDHEPTARLLTLTLISPLVHAIFHPSIVMCPFDKNLFCSPDDFVVLSLECNLPRLEELKTQNMIVEYKCPFSGVAYHEIPSHHYAQLLTNMKILDCQLALYSVWTQTELKMWIVSFDETAWEKLYSSATDFIVNYLDTNTRPPRTQRGKRIYDLMEETSPFISAPFSIDLTTLPAVIHTPEELEFFFVRNYPMVHQWFRVYLNKVVYALLNK